MKAERIILKILSIFTLLTGLMAVLMSLLFYFDATQIIADQLPGQLYEFGMRLSIADAGGFYRIYGLPSGVLQILAGFYSIRFASAHADLEGDAKASRARSGFWAFIFMAFVLSDALLDTIISFVREKPGSYDAFTLIMAPLIAFVLFALIISRRSRIAA